MGNLKKIAKEILEYMGIIINEFYHEEMVKSKIIIIISIIGMILFISLVIYSRIKNKDPENWVRKKKKQKKQQDT